MSKRKIKKRKKTSQKSFFIKDLTLVFISAIVTVILTTAATYTWSLYHQPSIVIDRAFYIKGIENVEKNRKNGLDGISKIKITNNSLSTIHNLTIPISKDVYIEEPNIIVDTFTQYTLKEQPFYSTVKINILPPKKHTIITIYGRYNDSVAKEISKTSKKYLASFSGLSFPQKIIKLPFVGTVSSNEILKIKYNVVGMGEIIKQEIKDGFVVNRFMRLVTKYKKSKIPKIIKLILNEKAAKTNNMSINYKKFDPGFNSAIVFLGAENTKGKKIPYVNGIEVQKSIFLAGNVEFSYTDLLHFYYPNYRNGLGMRISDEKEKRINVIFLSNGKVIEQVPKKNTKN